jgi:hypothetical protein
MKLTSLASIFCFTFFLISHSYSQEYKVYGKIFDSKSNKPLEFANVKVADTSYGTAADNKGEYLIKLTRGSWKLIFSCLGYFSDTIDAYIENQDVERNIYLKPSEIFTETIEVLGEDPAIEIVKKAIEYKKRFKENLNEYDFNSYTKYVIRSNTGGVNDQGNRDDTSKYPILSIMESETQGYFKKPDEYKEIVRSRRESESSMVSGIALPFIVNFYDEMIDFGFTKVTGPLADDALDYYDYKLLGTTSIDSQIVYRIQVTGSSLYPLFNGKIYISGSNYALMKIDLSTNDAVNVTAVDKFSFKQKFASYTDKKNLFWMPTDVETYAQGSFAGLIKFSFEAITIVSNYNLNKKAPYGIFDKFVVKVLPGAKKDSAYWQKNQPIKNTDEEKNAYKFMEKENKKRNTGLRFDFPFIRYGNNIALFTEIPYYYNRVEGSGLKFGLGFHNNSRNLNISSFIGYGFSDKKSKYEIEYSHTLLKDKSLDIEASLYKKLPPISYELSGIFTAFNTLTSLFDKQDYYDYYYASGFQMSVSKSLIPQINISLSYQEEKQASASNNTDYSIRKNDQPFRYNPQINDDFLRSVGLSTSINPNKFKYADLGTDGILNFSVTDFPVLNLFFKLSSKKLGSTFENKQYSFILTGENYFNNVINIKYDAGGVIYAGQVPYQSLASFNSTSAFWDKNFSFKTMGYREYLGDYIYYLNFENNFGNILWSKLPVINKLELIGFFNAAKSGISNENYTLASDKNFSVIDKVFCEAGFGIKGILELLRFDFAWRLTNRVDGRNFNFSLSFGI